MISAYGLSNDTVREVYTLAESMKSGNDKGRKESGQRDDKPLDRS